MFCPLCNKKASNIRYGGKEMYFCVACKWESELRSVS